MSPLLSLMVWYYDCVFIWWSVIRVCVSVSYVILEYGSGFEWDLKSLVLVTQTWTFMTWTWTHWTRSNLELSDENYVSFSFIGEVVAYFICCICAWTPYRHYFHSLDKFHLRCLRQIARIRWQDKVLNTDILERCNTTGIEAVILRSQLCLAGHLTHMPDRRIPKIVFYFELQHGVMPRSRQKLWYKDNLKANLISAGIDTSSWESATSSRTSWHSAWHKGIRNFEKKRIDQAIHKHQRCRDAAKSMTSWPLSHVNISAQSVGAGVQQRSAWRLHENSQHQLTPLTRDLSVCLGGRLHHYHHVDPCSHVVLESGSGLKFLFFVTWTWIFVTQIEPLWLGLEPLCFGFELLIGCRHFDRQVLLVSCWLVMLLLGCSVQFCS